MTPERWQQVQRVLDEALERPLDERGDFLALVCGGDSPLREAVESLIMVAEESTDTFIDQPVARLAPKIGNEEPGLQGELGAYRLLDSLGRGGMGDVYRAVRADDEYQQQVAIKVVRWGGDSETMLRRFRSERQILANLDHPNIAKLLDGGTTGDGRPYLVMEYVDGRALTTYCEEMALPLQERLDLFRKVCDAVHFAHQNLIVHRDLKPGNILVNARGEPKLLDFGIAKLLRPEIFPQPVLPTATGLLPMTPEYASPEQVIGEPITTASDIYALGMILYELLTGQRAYNLSRRSPQELIRKVCETEPPRPSTAVTSEGEAEGRPRAELRKLSRQLHGDLDNIVLKALRKEPRSRYGSAEQLARDLDRHLRGLPVTAGRDTLRYRAGKVIRRHRIAAAAVAAGVSMLLSLVVSLWVQRGQLLDQRNRAKRVSSFLIDLFETPDPDRARGRKVSAEDILAQGARQIGSGLREQPEVRADLMETMGRSYMNLGLFDEAETLLEEALELRLGVHGEEHAAVADSLHVLLELRTQQGAYEEGEVLGRRALEMRRRILGCEHEDVVLSHMALARLHELSGDLPAAETLYRDALGLARALGDSETLARVLNLYAILLHKQARGEDAEMMFGEALDRYRQSYGEVHPHIALTLNNLAALFEERGDYAQAEAHYLEAEETQRRLYGGDHPFLATTLNNLASLYERRGRLEESAELYDQALAMRRQAFGDEHPRVASTLSRRAEVDMALGDLEAAEALAREALELRRLLLGNEHPETAASAEQLARVLVGRRAYDEADKLYLEALGIQRRALGDDHPYVAVNLGNLAQLATVRGRHDEAEELYRQALGSLRDSLGPEHADVALMLYNLACAEQRNGKLEEARQSFRQALEKARAALGEEHLNVGIIMTGLASLELTRRDLEASGKLARSALAILSAQLPESHSRRLGTLGVLGESLKEQGRYLESEQILLEVHRLWREARGDDAESTRAAARSVAELYQAWGRGGEADRFRLLGRGETPFLASG